MNNNKYILYTISFLQGLVFYGAFSVVFRESRGLTLSNIFLLESIFLFLMLLFEIPWGLVGDKIGYKKTLVISFGLLLISKVIFYFSYSFLGFLFESIMAAIAISGVSGCDSALLYSSIDIAESDKAFGVYGAMGTTGFLVSSLVSSELIKYSIDLLAFATIISYSLAFLLSFTLKDVSERKKVKEKNKEQKLLQILRLVIKNKKIIAFIITIAILSETTHSIVVFFNQPLYIRSSIDLKYFGILTALMQIATFIAVKADKIKMKLGEKKLLNGAFIIIILCNFFLIKSNIAFITIVLIFTIEGAFAVIKPITETIKNESIKSLNRATILSIYAIISNVVAVVINIITFVTSTVSIEVGLLTSLILNLIGLIIIKFYLKADIKKLCNQ